MPKGGAWLGGRRPQRMDGRGVGAGSADGDGLEHLSAEEKACLLFLEETIESLDHEEDVRLSNDEPAHLPKPRQVANERNGSLASSSNLKHSQKTPSKGKDYIDLKPLKTCVAPVPSTVASKPPWSSSTANSDRVLPPQPLLRASDREQEKPAAPPEVNVVIPPPTKPRDASLKTAEGPLPRGPLSYDALVHLRKSTSTKTPLCPTVDHTIDSASALPVSVEGLKLGTNRPAAAKCPPPVAPKPRIFFPKSSVKSENEAPLPPDSSYRLKRAVDPEVVRLEALQKLGLLKETEAERDSLGPLPPPKSHSFLHPKPSRAASLSRSPSLSSSLVRSESENRPQQSGAGGHPLSRCEPRPAAQQNHNNGGHYPEAPPFTDPGSVEAAPTASPRPHNTTNAVGYTVMVVPGMGADRKEALRKLGLLKNQSR